MEKNIKNNVQDLRPIQEAVSWATVFSKVLNKTQLEIKKKKKKEYMYTYNSIILLYRRN